VATFESVGEAKAALARLQNFPIWGRQISLAFARDAPAAAAQHLDHRNLRPPFFASQKKILPSQT